MVLPNLVNNLDFGSAFLACVLKSTIYHKMESIWAFFGILEGQLHFFAL